MDNNAAREVHKRIWLQYKDEDGEPNDYGEGVTWCQDQVNDTDVEYIRADIAAALASNQPVAVDEVILHAKVSQAISDQFAANEYSGPNELAKAALLALAQTPCASKVFTRDELVEIAANKMFELTGYSSDSPCADIALRGAKEEAARVIEQLIAAKAITVREE